ncbi:MAG TPA: LLM class flavin-dependent oxidoreductase, partial [Stellaceae bacterium]|nr:LLM class flavin-dependent oxidoreductase [Stellaceae bacterium]
MRFVWFNLMPWPDLPEDFREKYRSVWVDIPSALYDPVRGHELYNTYLDQLEFAETVGYDGLGVNEHHANAYGLMPSPCLMAAALARRTSRAALVVLGSSIALYDPPIRVAEEFAMLDVISGGRSWRAFRLPSRWTRLRLRPGCRPSCASDIPNRTTSSAAPGQRTNPFVFKWPLHQAAARQLPAEAKPHPPKFVPGPEDDPLWTLPSVLITPHT